MSTRQEIFEQLHAAHSVLTAVRNGETVTLSEEERLQQLNAWADEAFASQEAEGARSRKLNFPDVSRYQVRQWMIERLMSQGLPPDPDAVVDGVIDAAVSDVVQRVVLKDRWRNVIVVPRDHLLVNPVGAAMGLTPAEIDAQWAAIGAL